MPVLEIRALPQHPTVDIAQALERTCVAIAEVYGCAPDQVWATWQTLEPGHYVEGQTAADNQPETSHPPIATLTCFEGKSDLEIEKVLLAAAQTLGAALGIPGNCFVTYVEARSGRVVAGNGLIRR